MPSSSSSLRSRSTSFLSPGSASSDSQGPWHSLSPRSVSNTAPSRNPDYLDVLHPLNQGITLGRWIETDRTGGMRARSAEIFYQQHGEWFYVGTFKAHRLPDLASDEFAHLDERTKEELIQGTLGAAHATVGAGARAGSPSGDERFDGRSMYNSGVLKVACVGLQCIGFNDALNRIMHAQSRLLVQGRTVRASSASSYLDPREKRNTPDVRVCITPPV
ncbi:hypothetical protein BS47DRAFT_15201 [Hydnum rufescens UP504]|uniref:DUF6697 domain-containing protein n=1 Tax=Hydnum rufescens UP504 TaxID=1448309 RepID=A0A9P6E0X1_9AGAM|nr:hypothetical protein BS47DRAFT_15201 [Hydnum rufescens UP504]